MRRGGLWYAQLFATHCDGLPLPWCEQPSEPPFPSWHSPYAERFDATAAKSPRVRRQISLRAEEPCGSPESGQDSFDALRSYPARLFCPAGKVLSHRLFEL